MNDEDRDWFENLLKSKIENFGVKIDEVIDQRPVIYADFMIQAVDSRTYDYVADHKKVDIVHVFIQKFKNTTENKQWDILMFRIGISKYLISR